MVRVLALFICFSSFIPSLSAQVTPAPVRVGGEAIVVTADAMAEPVEDAGDSVSVITAEDLQRSQSATVAEALRDIAGVSIVQSGSLGHTTSAFMRGASASQVLLLIDGVEINDPFFGGADLGSLLASGIERIEVVRGAQSPLYGSQAMAGVINVVTARRRTVSGVDGTLRAEGGSMSTHRESIQLSGGSEAWQWKLGAGHLDTEGQFTNDELRDLQLDGRIVWSREPRSTITLHALAGDAHVGIPFSGVTPTLHRESDSKLTVGGADYVLHGSPLLNLDVRASFTQRDDAFEDPDARFSRSSSHISKLWRGLVQNTMLYGSQSITFGIEQKSEDVYALSNDEIALDETTRTTAVYAQDRLERGAFVLTGGVRIDRHSRFGSHASPRLSAAYRVNGHWRLRASAGRAFRAPSVGELAYPFYGNPELDPETSRSWEGGADVQLHQTSVSFTAFTTRYRDLISFDPVTFVAANIGRATIHGAELSAGVTFGEAWRLNTSYTHLKTRDEETELPLYRRPRNLASVTLSYAREGWSVSANANAVGRRFERDFETFSNRYNGSYLKVDAAATYRLRADLRLTARIENLLDREYAEALAFPAPGRALHGGLQFGF